MWPFKCKHPAHLLGTQREHTTEPTSDPLVVEVTYHLVCACGVEVQIAHAHITVGIQEWLTATPLTAREEAIRKEVFGV